VHLSRSEVSVKVMEKPYNLPETICLRPGLGLSLATGKDLID